MCVCECVFVLGRDSRIPEVPCIFTLWAIVTMVIVGIIAALYASNKTCGSFDLFMSCGLLLAPSQASNNLEEPKASRRFQ